MLELGLWETEIPPIQYYPNFFKDHCKDKATEFLNYSLDLQWTQNKFGAKQLPLPRLEVAYGDPGIVYKYSGNVVLRTLPWDPWLERLRDVIVVATGHKFNFCIGNYYRSGSDSIGWHADDELVLGINPVIASISLGATRKFQMRRKPQGEIHSMWLEHGSLLIMEAGTQEEWLHQLPKDIKSNKPRINWTFRLAKNV